MALGDGPASVEQMERNRAAMHERRAFLERADADERARMSDIREWMDGKGCTWRYRVVDGAQVRIESCVPVGTELVVPATIDDRPVTALAADACSHLEEVERIRIPDPVTEVGFCAFRDCGRLRSIAFPAGSDAFDPDWLRGCGALEEMTLPGNLEKIAPAVFDAPALKRLKVGAGTRAVLPGAFMKSRLESIEVDPENPWLRTDGKALYSADGRILLALTVPVREYAIAEGCIEVAKKALSSFPELASLGFPDTLETIGDYACAKTGISAFVAPAALKRIGERAFFACERLEEVVLNEGLETIGENAFTGTAIRELTVPASVTEMAFPLAARTTLVHEGPDATFRIAPDSATYLMDDAGGLYVKTADGLHMARMLEPSAEEYRVHAACVAIDEGAFLGHGRLRRVMLPEGLRHIGAKAFRDCHELVEAALPDTLEEVEDEAFLGTNLAALRIPAALRWAGHLAFVSDGAFHGATAPSIVNVTVAEGNPRFRMENGMLLERLDACNDSVLLCPATTVDAIIPATVKRIAPYAFNGVRTLRTLRLSDRITMVEPRGLGFDSMLQRIRIDLEEPIEGHETIELDLPATTRTAQQMMLAFGTSSFVDVGAILTHYDNSIMNANGFDAATEERMEPYEQVRRILVRLRDPLCMTPANRGLAERVIEGHFAEFCEAIARHDDREAIESMLDLGFIDADSIAEAIECVTPVQDASITNYLLEAKRRRFGRAAVDFDADFAL